MTALLGIHNLFKAYGTEILYRGISFTIATGDRIGLLGPNGSGKSTLLKILMDLESPDEGSISRRQGLRVGYVSQAPEFSPLSLEEVLLQNAPEGDPHELATRARILLGKAQFTDFSQRADKLSGGWKKRLDLARALMQEPDLLLLDEPTNHLDLEGILWLEKLLARENITYLVVSHDRYFLENVSNKIIELNRCYPQGLLISDGGMSDFMEYKEIFLEAQEQRERGLASVVRSEVEWLRRSPPARTTKSQSRITRAYELMEELSQVKQRNKVNTVELEFSASERATRKLITAKNLGKSLGGKQLFEKVDITLAPGTRLGIVGKNGTGKTTLLKILSGDLTPDVGTIKYADDLKLVYFDQHREQIPNNITLRRALSPLSDVVNYRGNQIHVNGWAKRFLFSPDRLELPVGCLSGGERARILIAKLMLEPADVLFLDEPTNDLDIPTLEVIEQSLKEFAGAVVLISHDRCLMDRLCTSILGLGEGAGVGSQFYADYKQWEEACLKAPASKQETSKSKDKALPSKTEGKKLSYKERKELDAMEEGIHAAEASVESLQQQIHEATEYSAELYQSLTEAQTKVDRLYSRWQELLDKEKGT